MIDSMYLLHEGCAWHLHRGKKNFRATDVVGYDDTVLYFDVDYYIIEYFSQVLK